MIEALCEVAPRAIIDSKGILLEPFEAKWVVLRKAITLDARYGYLSLDGQWITDLWDDQLALMNYRHAVGFADEFDGVAANFADVIRKARAQVEPRYPCSHEWWNWVKN